jgi:hypothetical protein
LIPAKISKETYNQNRKTKCQSKIMLTIDNHQQGEAYHHTTRRGKRSQAGLEQASKQGAHSSNACPEVSRPQELEAGINRAL